MKNKQIWNLCKVGVVIITALTFTPLVTPSGGHEPTLIGMPYTLWMTIVVTLILLGLTWIGTAVHPGRNE